VIDPSRNVGLCQVFVKTGQRIGIEISLKVGV
jgi:hypothetical protein